MHVCKLIHLLIHSLNCERIIILHTAGPDYPIEKTRIQLSWCTNSFTRSSGATVKQNSGGLRVVMAGIWLDLVRRTFDQLDHYRSFIHLSVWVDAGEWAAAIERKHIVYPQIVWIFLGMYFVATMMRMTVFATRSLHVYASTVSVACRCVICDNFGQIETKPLVIEYYAIFGPFRSYARTSCMMYTLAQHTHDANGRIFAGSKKATTIISIHLINGRQT